MQPFETRPEIISTKKLPGFCIVCSDVATTKAIFQLEDATIIWRYCDKHLADASYSLKELRSKDEFASPRFLSMLSLAADLLAAERR